MCGSYLAAARPAEPAPMMAMDFTSMLKKLDLRSGLDQDFGEARCREIGHGVAPGGAVARATVGMSP
jgi:hypothetical protein